MKLQNLLVPVDFSVCSRLVARQAAELAQLSGGELTFLHVATLPSGVASDAVVDHDGTKEPAGAWVTRDAKAQLGDFLADAAAANVRARAEVVMGDPADAILQTGERLGSDLIVMGTHGRSGLARMVHGSVAESVLHRAHVPVLLIRREARPECARADCQWCPHKGLSRAEKAVLAEANG